MAAPPPEGSMRLKVLRMGGTTYDVVVLRTATCEDLKRQLVNLASLPVERQRLIFRGRVLPNESRLSDAGVTNNCTLHLVEWQLGAGQQPQQQQQQGAAATGAGANWAEMLGGLFGAPPGAAAGAGGVQGTVLGPFVVNAGGAGGDGDLGTAIAQHIASALGGMGLQPATMPPPAPPGPGGPPPPRPPSFLRMPTLPAPRPPGAAPAAHPHLLTGLNLMTSRMEHEYDEPELDPLPRIREHYGRPGGPEVMHFLRAARTLLNSAQLLRRTRDAIDSVLESAGLPTLRPAPWQHEGDEDEDESGDESGNESGDESAGGQRQRQTGPRTGRSSAASQGAAVRSFPVSADNSDAEPDDEGAVPWQPARARSGASSASGAAAAAGATPRRGVTAARGGDSPPPLETDSDSDSPRQQRRGLGRRGGRDSDAESMPGLTEEDSEDDYTDEDDVGGSVPTESLILVAAVCLGELTARFLDVAGANSDDALWDLADELRALTRVQRQDYPSLAETVQQLTARMYRLGSVWSELSRGMQYLGAALETGNMAIVNAIPGYLVVHGSQASPNLQRPGFPPVAYHQPVSGYFGGQIPDSAGMGSMGSMPLGAVVDITVGSTGQVIGAPAGGAPAQQAGQAQQPQQAGQPQQAQQRRQQGGAQQGQAPTAVGITLQQVLGNLPGILGGAAVGGAAAGQPAGQPPAGRPEVSSMLSYVSHMISTNRGSMDQVAQRIQEARNAMQALITGREGGPQQVLQRAHTTMQALVSAEEILRRARERAGQAAQQVQRIARTEQQNQQLRDELQQQLRESNQRHAQIQQEQAELAQTVREVMARQGAAGRAAAPAGGAAASGRQQQQGAAGAQGMDGVAANVAAVAQQLMAGLGMSPVEQHDMLARISGAAQALQQASLSALDIPSLLEDVRTSLGTAVRDVVQQVRAADIPSSGARAAAGEAATGAAGSGQDEVAVLTEAAVPALVAAVQGVLNRHFSRVMEAPQLQQFVQHLQDHGINWQPLATGAAYRAAPTETAAPTSAAPATAAGPAATAPGAPVAPAATAPAAAAAAATPAPPVSAPAPTPAPQPASVAAPPSSATAAAEAATVQAAGALDAHAASQAALAGPSSSSSQQAAKPAGLGLGKGLGRPAIKKRPAGVAAKPAASSAEAGMQAAAALAALAEASAPKPRDAATEAQAAPEAAATQHKPAAIAAPEEPAGSASAEPATEPAATETAPPGSSQTPQPATDTATASPAGPLVSQQRGPAPRGAAAGGGSLASLMSGLLGGPAGGASGAGGGGGGLMDLMGSVMQSPALMQMAQSPAMQQMADRMLGGGSGGGSLDLGSMMNDMLGVLAGPPGQGRQGPRARGMDGVLGGAGEGAAPADLDSVLSVLPEEEAVRWKGIIEADTQRQERMLAAEAAGAGADSGFSDAYSALRMAGRRGASSGLLGLLDSRDEEGAEE